MKKLRRILNRLTYWARIERDEERLRSEIEAERRLQSAAREKRKAERGYIPVKTLYTGCSNEEKPYPAAV